MIIFEISVFDYVGLGPKSIDYGPLRAENRQYPVSPEMRGRIQNLMSPSNPPSSNHPKNMIRSELYILFSKIQAFSGLLPVSRALPVTGENSNTPFALAPTFLYMLQKSLSLYLASSRRR